MLAASRLLENCWSDLLVDLHSYLFEFGSDLGPCFQIIFFASDSEETAWIRLKPFS